MAGERLTKIEWRLPFPAMGKPRMTRRDRWKKRPLIRNYFSWCDMVRLTMESWPNPEEVYRVEIETHTTPPTRFGPGQKRAMYGTLKRTPPDPDNVAKAFLDTWWKNDAGVGDLVVRRRWWDKDEVVITMHLNEEAATHGEDEG
jgi:Holliday junction resolvase RusA-like endonuclease